ncbi:MAG: HesA/MoeB/ThiF family protein [Clostridiales bacterium]|nr:HesA/MoeB/ThiF family protein [Clostridiales bacterium]
MADPYKTNAVDISEKSAAVIGCGGLGCNISVHLAGLGIGRLILADFDTVSKSNLNRQFLYKSEDIGKPKCGLAAQRLKAYAPECDIITESVKIKSEADLNFAKNCDIIFLAVDNNAARKLVQGFCAKHNIPLVNGGINRFFGTAYLYVPGKAPCLACAGLVGNETKDLTPITSTVGIIGALQVELGVKYLSGSYSQAGILYIYDNGTMEQIKITPQKDCGICGVKK